MSVKSRISHLRTIDGTKPTTYLWATLSVSGVETVKLDGDGIEQLLLALRKARRKALKSGRKTAKAYAKLI